MQRIEAASFLDAITKYRACYTWPTGSGERTPTVKRCSDASLDDLPRSSAIHAHLARLTARRLAG